MFKLFAKRNGGSFEQIFTNFKQAKLQSVWLAKEGFTVSIMPYAHVLS